jgi:hypothetical protein
MGGDCNWTNTLYTGIPMSEWKYPAKELPKVSVDMYYIVVLSNRYILLAIWSEAMQTFCLEKNGKLEPFYTNNPVIAWKEFPPISDEDYKLAAIFEKQRTEKLG